MQKYPLPPEIEAKRSRIKAIHGKVIRSPATKTHARTIISHIAIAAPPRIPQAKGQGCLL